MVPPQFVPELFAIMLFCSLAVQCATNTHLAGDAGAARRTGAIAGESTIPNHHQRAPVVDAAAKSRAGYGAASARAIPADEAVADDQRARIVDTPT